MEVWMSPCTGGKRPRSPVERLADLQQGGQGDDDEANWRSSKRYFTEVISSGFSKLTFSRGMQPQGQSTMQQPMQQQQGGSPAAYHLQAPGGLMSPREDSDCEMEMQESPTWPPHRSSPGSNGNRLQRAPSFTGTFSGLTSPPGPATISAVQYPFGSYSSPAVKAPQQAGVLPGPQLGAAAGSPVLPPKVLKAVEKPPNSPSDLPTVGGNLRKVALLRALLVRTEHHVQHQQCIDTQPGAAHDVRHQQQQPQHQQGQHCEPNASMLAQHQQQQLQEQALGSQAVGHDCSTSRPPDTPRPGFAYACSVDEQHGTCSHTSEDMDCSSNSMGDSPSSTPCSAAMPVQAALEDLSASALLCTEVLAHTSRYTHSLNQQQQQPAVIDQAHQQQHIGQQQPPRYVGPKQQARQQSGRTAGYQAQQAVMRQAQHQQQQQQQQQQSEQSQAPRHQHPLQMLPPRPKLKSPELSKDRLEALRAKAIAGTSKLSDLEPEDLHSLQISLNASQCRRGSDHVHIHSTLAPAAASARRHSSHI